MPETKLDVIISAEGQVILKPATVDVRVLKGLLKRKDGPAVTVQQMNAAIAAGAGRKKK